jgi:DNA-directed RNA polymerase subunit RPC12/RpoP
MTVRVIAPPPSHHITCNTCKARLAYESSDVCVEGTNLFAPNIETTQKINYIVCPICANKVLIP